jgi:hypothetical protein
MLESDAGPVVDAPVELSLQMTVSDLNLAGTAPDVVSTVALDIVRASIQRITWECVDLASIEAAAGPDGNVFDEITIDIREKTLLPQISKLKADFRLPFGGTISWTKGKMSFLIGKFKHLPIYLNGDDHKDLSSLALSIPWCMPTVRKGSAGHRTMTAATTNASDDGETVQVGFWDVITSVGRSDFKVELRHGIRDIPPEHDKLVLTFPFVKANPVYAGRENVPLRRTISDHEMAVSTVTKQNGSFASVSMGPKTTAQARLDFMKESDKPKLKVDKEAMQLAKHLLS